MKKPVLALVVFALTQLAACSGGDDESTAKSKGKGRPDSAVGFNEGAKWTADPGTNTGVDALRAKVAEAIALKDASARSKLFVEMDGRYAEILKNTTMKDEALKQLEKYMLSVRKTMDSLKTADPGAAEEILINLENQLKTYSAFFE